MEFDIIIIGGGMVGAALACALRNTSYKVAIVDATPLTPSEDPRLIALNYSSYCLFKNLNIWKSLAPHATPIETVHISHRGHFGATRLSAAEFKLPTLGYTVPAKFINGALYEALQSINQITLIRPATLTQLNQLTDKVELTIKTPLEEQKISGKLVIGADGTHSTVRELLNIPTKKIDYQQSAIVTITDLARSHQHIAYERFQKTGAIAMLPLVGDRAATIWTDDKNNILELMQFNDIDFLNALQKQFGYRLGRLKNIGKRFVFPLQLIQAEYHTDRRVILLGNAAHTLHPIAAQGLNLALYEIAMFVDYFSKNSLTPPFANWNKSGLLSQQQISTRLSHHLSWLFANDFFGMNTVRQLGLIGLDLCLPLKKSFATRAIGQSGRIPQLLLE